MAHGQCDATPMATFPAAGHHRILTGTKLYCLVTEAHVNEQLSQSCYLKMERLGVEPATFCVASQHPNHYTTRPCTSAQALSAIGDTTDFRRPIMSADNIGRLLSIVCHAHNKPIAKRAGQRTRKTKPTCN